MTRDEFKKRIDLLHRTLHSLSDSKGIEYANSDDQLANFKRLGEKLGTIPEVPCLVFLTKHLDSIDHFVKTKCEGKGSEPIHERIVDAILYLMLLDALIDERSKRNIAQSLALLKETTT